MRSVTLFTGQFADIPLEQLAAKAKQWGYDGLELACWGDHVDVDRAAKDKKYARGQVDLLARHGLKVFAISNHLAGQLVCDPNNDARSDLFAPKACAGDAEAKRKWAVAAMKNTARAAQNMGVKFEEIVRTLNVLNYEGPLSVEWEDALMNREAGAAEACRFVRNLDFPKSDRVFDEALRK